ncbi:hypothetical protein BJY52DRAFT_1192401 [Lactarius psammicola]|nr:hypothetical protein BJY52DRAFT_1192401 [Lactarius psammicola]
MPSTTRAGTAAAAAVYKLWCLVEREENPFLISIAPEKHIYNLQKLVLEECGTDGPFKGAHAKDLKLTKVNVDLHDRQTRANISTFRPNTNDQIDTIETISEEWPTKPPDRHISVFIHLPGQTAISMRPPADDDLDIAHEPNFLTLAPSQLGKPARYKPLQGEPNERILDDRPEADLIPPASLLYHGFGRFMDDFRSRKDIRVDQKQRDLEMRVDHFADEMTRFYETELSRMEKGIDTLEVILGITLTPAAIGGVFTDGHHCGPHKAVTCIVEFKNEPVDIEAMAMIKLIGYVARSHLQSMVRYGFKDLFRVWNVPCLGLTVVGPHVTFYSITFLGPGKWRIVSLTPTLSCVASACEGRDRMALYTAFSGALTLLHQIDEDVKRHIDTPPTLPHTDRMFPYVSELPNEHTSRNVRFRILSRHPNTRDYPDHHLYIAKTLDVPEKEIIVKFTRRYSIDLHNFCAERGHAPSILGFSSVPGGWFVVAMDYISPSVYPSQSRNLVRLRDKWKGDLKTLVQSFHEANLVHGDLREPNMICSGETIMLVDFDWGGRAGEVSYPHARLNPELTNGRESVDGKIMKDDDDRILDNTLARL